MKIPGINVEISKGQVDIVISIWDTAKSNATLRALAKRFDGCDAAEAYAHLQNLSDHELRVLAALIGQTNQKFGRKKQRRISA